MPQDCGHPCQYRHNGERRYEVRFVIEAVGKVCREANIVANDGERHQARLGRHCQKLGSSDSPSVMYESLMSEKSSTSDPE